MKKTSASERIAEACQGIIRRSDQIVAMAETPDAELSRIFSRKEIQVTNGICCELALAVADSESVDDLAENRENFERMRRHVMAANEALAERTSANPQTMSSIMNAEDTLIDLLVAADPTVRLMAGFAKKHMSVVKSTLTAFYTDLRLQLATAEGKGGGRVGRIVKDVLSAPVGSLFLLGEGGLLERYGDERFARKRVIAFVRKIYRESDPKTRSWTGAVRYVRSSHDGRCAEIRKTVAGFAKPGEEGLEKAWNSIRQQAKVLDERLLDEERTRK